MYRPRFSLRQMACYDVAITICQAQGPRDATDTRLVDSTLVSRNINGRLWRAFRPGPTAERGARRRRGKRRRRRNDVSAAVQGLAEVVRHVINTQCEPSSRVNGIL